MVPSEPFWLVAREMVVTTDLDTWSPWGHPAPLVIIIVIGVTILAQPREVRRAVVDIVRALADLAWAVQELARAVLA